MPITCPVLGNTLVLYSTFKVPQWARRWAHSRRLISVITTVIITITQPSLRNTATVRTRMLTGGACCSWTVLLIGTITTIIYSITDTTFVNTATIRTLELIWCTLSCWASTLVISRGTLVFPITYLKWRYTGMTVWTLVSSWKTVRNSIWHVLWHAWLLRMMYPM